MKVADVARVFGEIIAGGQDVALLDRAVDADHVARGDADRACRRERVRVGEKAGDPVGGEKLLDAGALPSGFGDLRRAIAVLRQPEAAGALPNSRSIAGDGGLDLRVEAAVAREQRQIGVGRGGGDDFDKPSSCKRRNAPIRSRLKRSTNAVLMWRKRPDTTRPDSANVRYKPLFQNNACLFAPLRSVRRGSARSAPAPADRQAARRGRRKPERQAVGDAFFFQIVEGFQQRDVGFDNRVVNPFFAVIPAPAGAHEGLVAV